jgi:hypothetical protein
MNQLFTDLCAVKALVIEGGIAQGIYAQAGTNCRCHIVKACGYDPECFNTTTAFEEDARVIAVCEALAQAVPPIDRGYAPTAVEQLFHWNDKHYRTKADVIDLVQRAANRAGGGDA